MLHNHPLSSKAAAIRCVNDHKKFNINDTYGLTFVEPEDRTIITEKYRNHKVQIHARQHCNRKRDTTNNIGDPDHEFYEDPFVTEPCYLCDEWLTWDYRPTLDRVDDSIGHSKDNVQPWCVHCNVTKSDGNELATRQLIRLRMFAIKSDLPMALDSSETDAYHIIRKGITGGPSMYNIDWIWRASLRFANSLMMQTQMKYLAKALRTSWPTFVESISTHCIH